MKSKDKNNVAIGERIKEVRLNKNLTQELLAEKGYTGPYVFEVGFANRGKPTIEELRTLISEWERITE